jgi:hypothetical protein
MPQLLLSKCAAGGIGGSARGEHLVL